MDLDRMAIEVRKLNEFRTKYEPLLEELAKAKGEHDAAHARHAENLAEYESSGRNSKDTEVRESNPEPDTNI